MKRYSSLFDIRQDLSAGEISVTALVQHYLNNIESGNHINAFLEVFATEALEKATLVDKKIKEGTAGKLAGLVIGIKDNLCYQGHKVSASSKILEGFESLYTATAVQKLLNEDAIIIGRCNCDEFAMGSSNENSAFGNVLNPLDNSRVPGGSSGGSAAAVAADMCHASLGTDTGGSIRQPASLCGLVGIKPTYGRVSRYGAVAYASSFDQIGPITRSVEDNALMLEVMAGKDNLDSTASAKAVPEYSKMLGKDVSTLRIAYISDCLEREGLDPEIKQRTLQIVNALKEKGHVVEPVSFPYLDYLVPAYYVLTTAEASSNLARYDGIHYGHRSATANSLESVYKRSRSEGFGKEVKRRIVLGTFVLSSGYYDAYYSKGQKVRRLLVDKTNEILSSYDIILSPTTPGTAFRLGENTADPIKMYLEDIFTAQAPLTGIPAISLPMGKHSNGLPFGIQLMGRRFDEATLFAFGKYIEKI